MVTGKITDYNGEKLTRANISLFDPQTYQIIETIPVDDLGEYLFTLKKGQRIGLLVEKDGYFPYYDEFTVPEDADKKFDYPLHLPDGIRKEYTLVYPANGFIPVNRNLLEELISLLLNQTALSLWMPDQENPLGKARIDFLDSLLQTRNIEKYRLISGSLPGNTEQIVEVSFLTDEEAAPVEDYPAAAVNANANIDQKWTLQFSASKKELSSADLKGLKDVNVYQGKDGFLRYTYGIFDSRQEANQAISTLRTKGFAQAFPKLIGNLKKL